MASGEGATIIGRSAVLRGEFSGEGDVQIDGTLEGSVRMTDARITVGPDATVRALVQGRDIVVHGSVEGNLLATGRVELLSTAVVTGDIFAARFSMEQEAVLRGHVDVFEAAKESRTVLSSPQTPLSFREDHIATFRPTGDKAAPPRASANLPSGLAAAAASVSTNTPTSSPSSVTKPHLPQPAWAAEPRSS